MNWKILCPEILTSPDQLIKQLLEIRNLKTKSQIEEFLHPEMGEFEKELEISGIKTASKRILQAIENKELIVVYGDYDVDGLCATAIVYLGLSSIGAKVLPYIPHREKEGYGLSKEGLEKIKHDGAKLVITVDNGIVAKIQAKYAKKLDLDLIITDHHIPGDEKPEVFVIVHSVKMGGAAVAWCLIRNLIEEKEAEKLLDLVAIATIGDMIPLIGLNRSLVKEGIKVLNKTDKVGLLALFNECKIDVGKLISYHVSHQICPRLNAIGRMEHSIDALRLLCTKDTTKAIKLAKLLCETNIRKKIVADEAILEAKSLIGPKSLVLEKLLILQSPNWIPGIIGLIAAKISEEYHLPTVVISQGETFSKGSARSNNGLDIIKTLRECSDLLIDIGGHPGAAGFTIETIKISEFRKKITEVMKSINIKAEDSGLEIDALVDLKKINRKWIDELDKLEPFGMGNPRPILGSKDVKISQIKAVGSGQHLKFVSDGIDAIAFGKGELSKVFKDGDLASVAYNLELNEFNGKTSIQLKVIDISPK